MVTAVAAGVSGQQTCWNSFAETFFGPMWSNKKEFCVSR
jgi:hypothetical protein